MVGTVVVVVVVVVEVVVAVVYYNCLASEPVQRTCTLLVALTLLIIRIVGCVIAMTDQGPLILLALC